MVKKEYKYFGTISFMFILSIASMALLFRKYALLTFDHFIETCRQLATTFFSSGSHFVGLILIVLTLLVAGIFISKTLFSFMKTQKRIKILLASKSNIIPRKLQSVLEKINIDEETVVVIQKQSSYAFNYGVRSQKILISEGLIKKLTTKQLEAVVLHELYHLENKHSLLLILSEIISSTLFFLPLVKEINNKMKIVFEKEADVFTSSIQGKDIYLNQALLKVSYSKIFVYPSFSKRNSHKFTRVSVLSSFVVVMLALILFLFPTRTHAIHSTVFSYSVDACSETQCETHCPTDNMSQESIMSPNLQHDLLSVSS